MITNDLRQVLGEALACGGDFAEVFVERRKSSSVSLEATRVEKILTGVDQGAGIRLLSGDSSIYVYTNDLSLTGLMEAASRAALALKDDKQITKEALSAIKELRPKVDSATTEDKINIEAVVDLMLLADNNARAAGDKIKQVLVRYGHQAQEMYVANSLGRMASDHRTYRTMIVNVVAADGGVVQTGYESLGSCNDDSIFTSSSIQSLAEQATIRSLALVSAKPAPTGRMPVVLSGQAGGTMIHEACGHGLEADIVGKGMSVYANKLGQMVASELVTVVDDPTIPGKYGSYVCDDEGTPAKKNTLIKNGKLEMYMSDLEYSRRQNVASTGNGRRQSFKFRPIPRMSNTYLAPGSTSPEEIIEATDSGLLVKRMGGGQVNPTTGDFVFDVAEGYIIDKGQISFMVRGATLSGNGPSVLTSVDLIGTDLGFAIGTCGKDGQGVPVSDAQPTMRIPQLVVGGLLQEVHS